MLLFGPVSSGPAVLLPPHSESEFPCCYTAYWWFYILLCFYLEFPLIHSLLGCVGSLRLCERLLFGSPLFGDELVFPYMSVKKKKK